MADEPLVHIILVNWNGREITLECLHSLHSLTYAHYRIIVVDNASTDGSVEAIGASFPDVITLHMQENVRFAGGNNAGIRYAIDHHADMILLLNNDTIVDSEFLSRLVQRMRDTPRAGMIVPKIYYFEKPDVIWYAGGVISFWTGTLRHVGLREPDRGNFDQAGETDYATGCCILASAKVVNEVGLLDKSYHMYTEDADWSMRVRNAGYTIVCEPSAHVWHKVSTSSGGHLSWYKIRNKYISNMKFFWRYGSWAHRLVFPWLSILRNVFLTIRYLLFVRGL